jgi:hypothetical protein
MIIIGIDIGVKNMGISSMEWSDDFETYSLRVCEVVDISTFPHRGCEKECTLHHDNTYSDFIDHFFQYYYDELEIADLILLERQPPMGYVVVEQLIFHQYRKKSILVHPCSLHKYFQWYGDYEMRKGQSIKTAVKHVADTSKILHSLERAHDVSDSICFILYYGLQKRDAIRQKKLSERVLGVKFTDEYTVSDFLDSFTYKSK